MSEIITISVSSEPDHGRATYQAYVDDTDGAHKKRVLLYIYTCGDLCEAIKYVDTPSQHKKRNSWWSWWMPPSSEDDQ